MAETRATTDMITVKIPSKETQELESACHLYLKDRCFPVSVNHPEMKSLGLLLKAYLHVPVFESLKQISITDPEVVGLKSYLFKENCRAQWSEE